MIKLDNQIGDDGADELVEAFKSMDDLEKLNLYCEFSMVGNPPGHVLDMRQLSLTV